MDVGDIPKLTGVKWNGKEVIEAVPKKAKTQRKPKSKISKPAMVDKDLEERTISVVQGDNVHKEKDTTYTLQV